MSRRLLALSALLCSLPLALPAPALADVKAGVDAWAAGDYDTAVSEWREPALAGDADAQFNLGQAYRLGRGVPANLDIALDWFSKAAAPREGGIIHQKAADEYGLTLFQTGQRAEALPYIQAAAQRGEPRAQYVLGTAYFNGQLVEKDWVRGYALMSRAASAGIPAAQRSLAQMDNYVGETQKTEALAMAASMQAGSGSSRTTGGFPVASVEPAPVARPVDVPPSQIAGTDYAPDDSGDVQGPVMAEAPAPVPTPAPVAAPVPVLAPVAQADDEPIARVTEVSDIPGYIPSVSARSPAPAAAANSAPVRAATPTPVVAASGNWRVQLGAFSTEARARALFDTLEKKVSGLSAAQPFLVDAGKVTRLQAGPFASKSAADKMCAAVKRAGNACFSLKK
ncbi:SPOR domain-containing protein [Novosphingopyxis sp.]|uniref:SPOR domain-containing protein n=1 Tax=Novosphingopyxis sp. TaxID=2709690 RepID=UPI003B5B8004